MNSILKLPRKIKKMLKTEKRLQLKRLGFKMSKREWLLYAIHTYYVFKYGIRISYSDSLSLSELHSFLQLKSFMDWRCNFGTFNY